MTERTLRPIHVRPGDAEAMFGVSRPTLHRWLKKAGAAITSFKRGNIRLIPEALKDRLEARSQ
ncbi:hypothetical protein BV509_14565 [Rhodovulum sulfidophilum]|nr:hypothetical protein BV509_14565 [Rhodovulum sulfidophilum]